MKANKVLQILQINRVTLYRYLRDGKIKGRRLSSGHYDYDEDSVFKAAGVEKRMPVIYLLGNNSGELVEKEAKILQKLGLSTNVKRCFDEGDPSDLSRTCLVDLINSIIEHKVSELIILSSDEIIPKGDKLIDSICKTSDCKLIKVDLEK